MGSTVLGLIERHRSDYCKAHGRYPESITIQPGTACTLLRELSELVATPDDAKRVLEAAVFQGERESARLINAGLHVHGVIIKAAVLLEDPHTQE